MAKKPMTQADKQAAANLRREWIKWQDARMRQGLGRKSQLEAAGDMGITQGAVSQYLNETMPLGTEAVLKFAQLLGVHPGEIRQDFRYSRTPGFEPPIDPEALRLAEAIQSLPPASRAHLQAVTRAFTESQAVGPWDEKTERRKPGEGKAVRRE
ncbi:hypothetical protein BH20PSE1_BH20PSE1_01370 [soil metagenome]